MNPKHVIAVCLAVAVWVVICYFISPAAVVKKPRETVVILEPYIPKTDNWLIVHDAAESVHGVRVCEGISSRILDELAMQNCKAQALRGRCGHFINHGKAEVAAMIGGRRQNDNPKSLWVDVFRKWMGSNGHRAIISRPWSHWGASAKFDKHPMADTEYGCWYFTLVCE